VFTDAPEFRLWIQRAPGSESPFALRWQVMGGRGTLLLPRGGGTDAAPATSSGTRSQLTLSDLATTRFLVVSDRSGSRNQFQLGPFEQAALGALDAAIWTALTMDQGGTALALPIFAQPEQEPAISPQAESQVRIAELEQALTDAQQRVAALTSRVAELEGKIDAAGGPSAG